MTFQELIDAVPHNPYYLDVDCCLALYHADYQDVVRYLSGISVVVTDPPYELGFMGRAWDKAGVSFQAETWRAIRDACLPGAPLLSFGGTRTFHRIACAIEDAGWEIRDTLAWVYGQGFPKGLNIGKAIDRVQGNEREDLGKHPNAGQTLGTIQICKKNGTGRLTKGRTVWEGYGTGLKPAYEPIILAMNPLDGTFAQNALKHKVAGLNIDGCRVGNDNIRTKGRSSAKHKESQSLGGGWYHEGEYPEYPGRFPTNFLHDGSQQVMELFPERKAGVAVWRNVGHSRSSNINYASGSKDAEMTDDVGYGDSGSAARFFYCAKASKAERNAGCEGLEERPINLTETMGRTWNDRCASCGKKFIGPPEKICHCDNPITDKTVYKQRNNHPTVKPLALMEYLCKLVKYPEYNLILDPFCGSGTTLIACLRLGIPCIGIDNDEQACKIAKARLAYWRGGDSRERCGGRATSTRAKAGVPPAR